MPIRFECPHCQRRLSVGSRQVGQRVRCPKCQGVLRVPDASGEAALPDSSPSGKDAPRPPEKRTPEKGGAESEKKSASTSSSATGVAAAAPPPPPPDSPPDAPPDAPQPEASESASDANPFLEFAVFDREESEWVYESDEEVVEAPVDRNRVAVSRHILYLQGGLLAGTALLCFFLGLLIGSTFLTARPESRGPVACTVHGRVEYSAEGPGLKPNRGSVVVIVPRDRHPDRETKMKIEDLHPSETPPGPTHPALQAIRSIGGDYARVDEQGEYELQVPNIGNYYLLFVSNHTFRPENQSFDKAELSEMGNYFAAATNMVRGNEYQWQRATIRGDKKVNIVFGG